MSEPRLWEVWRMDFKFDDDPSRSKERPVLIASKNDDALNVVLLSLKVTSHAPRTDAPGEVPLLDWREAGLSKPSTVRCTKFLWVPAAVFQKFFRYGRLSRRDEESVKNALIELGILEIP